MIEVLIVGLVSSIIGPLALHFYKIYSEKEISRDNERERWFSEIFDKLVGFRKARKEVGKQELVYSAYRQLWLHASDDTIRKINEVFMGSGAGRPTYDEMSVAKKAICEMALQMRKEFYGNKTNLKPEEFHLIFFELANEDIMA